VIELPLTVVLLAMLSIGTALRTRNILAQRKPKLTAWGEAWDARLVALEERVAFNKRYRPAETPAIPALTMREGQHYYLNSSNTRFLNGSNTRYRR